MYVGHVGAALGAKRVVPSIALGTFVIAAYLPDWMDATLCVTGRYHDAQMYSHSVPAVLVLAVLAGATQFKRQGIGPALAVAAVVISHVLLDYLTGIKPTWPGGPFIGLEIYRHPVVDVIVESALIIVGWLWYRQTLPRPARKLNDSSLMLLLLLLLQAGVDAGRLLFPAVGKC